MSSGRSLLSPVLLMMMVSTCAQGLSPESEQCQLDACAVRSEVSAERRALREYIRDERRELRIETGQLIKDGKSSLREDIAQLIQSGRSSLRQEIRQLIREERIALGKGGPTQYCNKLDTRPRDCGDIKKSNPNSASGVYSIYPEGSTNMEAYCDMETDGGGWLVFQKRFNGRSDFFRYWHEYADGFGSLTREFWWGNRKLSLLTNQEAYQLRVDLTDFDGNTAYAVYGSFSIAPETDNFTLSLGTYSGTAGGDSMERNRGYPFSTRDRDNDALSTHHIAVFRQGAWWYQAGGGNSNLNGLYHQGKALLHNGVFWANWASPGYTAVWTLKSTEMKIRRVFF